MITVFFYWFVWAFAYHWGLQIWSFITKTSFSKIVLIFNFPILIKKKKKKKSWKGIQTSVWLVHRYLNRKYDNKMVLYWKSAFFKCYNITTENGAFMTYWAHTRWNDLLNVYGNCRIGQPVQTHSYNKQVASWLSGRVCFRPVRSEFSPSAWRNIRSLVTHWAHSEESNQTGWMPRLV